MWEKNEVLKRCIFKKTTDINRKKKETKEALDFLFSFLKLFNEHRSVTQKSRRRKRLG